MKNKVIKEVYPVIGMACASCAINVETETKRQYGVVDAKVNYANQSILIEYDENIVNPVELKKAILDIGYDLFIEKVEDKEQNLKDIEDSRLKILKGKFLLALALSIPIFILSMFFMHAFAYEHYLLFILSLPVILWSGNEFYINAYKQLKHLKANMDTLVAIGTGVAFIYSSFQTFFPDLIGHNVTEHSVYFESASVVITFILLGRYLEDKAKSKASSTIKKLINLQPKMLTVIRDEIELSISLKEVILNDDIIVRPGERIAVDGLIIDGYTYIDESMLTGESVPVEKKINDKVFAGTINQNGSIRIKALKIGKDTMLSQIISLVEQAQASKPPVQKLVDKIAGIFVPVILVLALITFIVWLTVNPEYNLSFAIINTINVLVIACPCALGLAVPTALVVGIGKGAEKGFIVKNAEALEMAHKVNTVVFDKTGTLTKGKAEVTDIIWNVAEDKQTLINILYTLENYSDHPLGISVSSYLKVKGADKLETEEFENKPGYGVRVKVSGKNYYAGNENYVNFNNKNINDTLTAKITELRKDAKTLFLFADDNDILAVVAVSDTLRETALKAILDIKQQNIGTIIITGDNRHSAAALAAKTGVDNFIAEVLPMNKGKIIKEIQAKGNIIAMVGDGINDSNALAQADIGIAISSGSDIAIESAGIILMNADLRNVGNAIRLSNSIIKIIKQNLFWAFIYNVITIPIAAGALYPAFGLQLNPMIAGAAMAFSSVSVVTNSLRLKSFH